jgi:hypothetical protein
MSGKFPRIARRHADRPDEPSSDDAPTEQIAAVEAPPVEQPATPATSAPPAAIDVTTTPATDQTIVAEPVPRRPGFRARGRMRRRLRYLRKLRELQVRDLGGLMFDLRRFERKRDDLVAQKTDQIRACDDELHALERALEERRDLRDVREPGVGGTCPRCFAIFGSADKFCANCGAAFGGAVQGPAAQVPLAPPPPATQPPPLPPAPAAQPAPVAQPAPAVPPSPPAQPEASAPDQ